MCIYVHVLCIYVYTVQTYRHHLFPQFNAIFISNRSLYPQLENSFNLSLQQTENGICSAILLFTVRPGVLSFVRREAFLCHKFGLNDLFTSVSFIKVPTYIYLLIKNYIKKGSLILDRHTYQRISDPDPVGHGAYACIWITSFQISLDPDPRAKKECRKYSKSFY